MASQTRIPTATETKLAAMPTRMATSTVLKWWWQV
jgi:hypothetical protein